MRDASRVSEVLVALDPYLRKISCQLDVRKDATKLSETGAMPAAQKAKTRLGDLRDPTQSSTPAFAVEDSFVHGRGRRLCDSPE